MAQLTVAEYRRSLMALAEALSEPGRRFTPDEVMAKGHELNPGQYGPTHSSLKRCLGLYLFHLSVRVPRPLFMK